MKQDYILKKHVRAETIEEALRLGEKAPVTECYLSGDKPDRLESVIGFQMPLNEGIPYECRKR